MCFNTIFIDFTFGPANIYEMITNQSIFSNIFQQTQHTHTNTYLYGWNRKQTICFRKSSLWKFTMGFSVGVYKTLPTHKRFNVHRTESNKKIHFMKMINDWIGRYNWLKRTRKQTKLTIARTLLVHSLRFSFFFPPIRYSYIE